MKIYIFIIFITVVSIIKVSGQFKLNHVDTVSPMNTELLNFLWEYMEYRAAGNTPEKYWVQEEYYSPKSIDAYEQWENYYAWLTQSYTPTVLGIGKIEENYYKIKVMVETGMDSSNLEIYLIQDYLVKQTAAGLKLANILSYNLENNKYQRFSDEYFDYFLPKDVDISTISSTENTKLIKKLEQYFGSKLPYRFTYIKEKSCEELYRVRGIDYIANMMSTQTSVCGWTFVDNRIMYSSHQGFHKHEILRLLSLITPNAPLVLVDGITNLTGGAAGKPIRYHIQKLAPYLEQHPEKLDKIEDFWYYDNETNPFFVFHALATNYFLKTKGELAFLNMMKSPTHIKIDLQNFLREHCDITDVKKFYLQQIALYADENKRLEYENLL